MSMRQHGLVLAAILGFGCTPPPAPKPPAEPAPLPSASILPAEPETPDDAFRYVPPTIEPSTGWNLPPAQEAKLANGLHLVTLEQPGVDDLRATVVVKPESAPPVSGLDHVVLRLLIHEPDAKGAPPLARAFDQLAVVTTSEVHEDRLTFTFAGVASSVTEAVRLLLRRMAELAPTAPAFESARSVVLTSAATSPLDVGSMPVSEPLLRSAVAMLFLPKGNRANMPPIAQPALRKVGLSDVTKWARVLLRPDQTEVLTVGGLSVEGLRQKLQDVATWKPEGAKLMLPKPQAPRGVFLLPWSYSSMSEVSVLFPVAGEPKASWLVFRPLLQEALSTFLKRELPAAENARVSREGIRDSAFVRLAMKAPGGQVPDAVRRLLVFVETLAKTGFEDERLERVKDAELRKQEQQTKSLTAMSTYLASFTQSNAPAGFGAHLGEETRKLTRSDLLSLLAELKRTEARLVIVGLVPKSNTELEKLGLGPVTITQGPWPTPPAPKKTVPVPRKKVR